VTIEQLLTSLAGVISARAVSGSDGRLEEIHILATAELQPKQIVRNIESALSAGLGIEINRRIVSIAQLRAGEAGGLLRGLEPFPEAAIQADITAPLPEAAAQTAIAAPEPLAPGGTASVTPAPAATAAPVPPASSVVSTTTAAHEDAHHLVFLGHEVTVDASRTATCTVTFRRGDDEFTGQGEGFDSPQGRAEAAARAVFDAFERFRKTDRLGLEGVAIVDNPGRECVLVAARPLDGRRRDSLTGAALLRESPEEAAILAALQATNHWRAR
jgi:hypothetical protein